jgi:hypothetical protein
MDIQDKRNQLKELQAAIRRQLDAIRKIDKPHLHKQYEELKNTVIVWKQQEAVLISEIMEYNRKYVPSPLEDPRFNPHLRR